MARAGYKECVDMFSSRLLRKAYRPERRHEKCPEDVYTCEEEFEDLVAVAESTQPMDRSTWHSLCNDFSDRWEHVCHWVHPSRLEEVLTENLGLLWSGEYPPRPDTSLKTKVKSSVKAQRFRCAECSVICNSYSQYVIHAQGTKHAEALQRKVAAEAAAGRHYESPAAIPLDSECCSVGESASGQPQAYFKRDKAADALQETSSDSSSVVCTASRSKPAEQRPRTPREKLSTCRAAADAEASACRSRAGMSKMVALTAFLALSVPLDSYKPKQHDPYSFHGGYQPPGAAGSQQRDYAQYEQYAYGGYGYGNEQCEEELYGGYAGYDEAYHGQYQSQYQHYEQSGYGGYFEEPSVFSGARQDFFASESAYPASYVGSTTSQAGNNDELVDDDEEDDEDREDGTAKPTRFFAKRRLSYGGLERAWTTPEEASDHDYFTDGDDQSSTISSRSVPKPRTAFKRTNSLSEEASRKRSSDDASINTSHSSQDFEIASTTAASSDVDTTTVRSMESKVDSLVQILEQATMDGSVASASEVFSVQEPEVVSEAVLRACVLGNAFVTTPEVERSQKSAEFVRALPDAGEVAQHMSEDLLLMLNTPPTVNEVTEDMEPEQASFIDEKNAKIASTYLEVFCLAAHLFALGLLTSEAFKGHLSSFLKGLSAKRVHSGNTSLPMAAFCARLPPIFALLGSKGLIADIATEDTPCDKRSLPPRLQKVLCALHC